MRKYHSSVAPIVLGALLTSIVLLWHFSTVGGVSRWGTPESVLRTILQWFATGEIWPHLFSTVGIALAGLVIGGVVGLILAALCFMNSSLASIAVPVMGWMNSLPRILLVPIFIALLGIGLVAKLTMVITMTVFVFFFNAYTGLVKIDPRLIANARLLGATRLQTVRAVHVPLVFEWVAAGMRTAVGFAFIGAVIAEYFGSTSGLGYIVDLSYGMNRYDRAIAGLVVIFFTVGIIDWLIRTAERRWLSIPN